jgi:hypothetical protein
MMKASTTLAALLAASALLSACSKTATPPAPKAQAGATAATPAEAKPAPRAATYDPNLKPAEIVWDSPEKKAQWEARQAQLRQAQQAQPAQAVPPAPAAAR